jgi:AraC-like DNA-binding protein
VQLGIYTRAYAIIGLDRMVTRLGGDIHGLMAASGIPENALRKPDMLISNQRVCELVERAAAELDCPDFGLRWAMAMAPDYLNAGPVMALSRFVANAREWYRELIGYWAYHTNAYSFELIENVTADTSVFRYVVLGSNWSPRNCTEAIIANVVGICRTVAGLPDESPIEMRFTHSAPADTSLYNSFFGCSVKFDQPHTEIEFPNHMLDYRVDGRLQIFLNIIKRYIQHRIDRIEYYDMNVLTNVELAIKSLMGTGRVDLNSVAEALSLHPRKLNRLLTEEGSSYSQILEKVRRQLAMEMLENTEVPIAQIAGLLDYTTTAPFTSAFTKWAGTSPLQWRKSRRSKVPVKASLPYVGRDAVDHMSGQAPLP